MKRRESQEAAKVDPVSLQLLTTAAEARLHLALQKPTQKMGEIENPFCKTPLFGIPPYPFRPVHWSF